MGGKSCEAFSFCAPEIHFDLSTRSDTLQRVASTGIYDRNVTETESPIHESMMIGMIGSVPFLWEKNLRPQYPRFEFSVAVLSSHQAIPFFRALPILGMRPLGFKDPKLPLVTFVWCRWSTMRVPYLAEFRRNLLATDDWMDETRQVYFKKKQLVELNYPTTSRKHLARPLRVSKRQGHIVVPYLRLPNSQVPHQSRKQVIAAKVLSRGHSARARRE